MKQNNDTPKMSSETIEIWLACMHQIIVMEHYGQTRSTETFSSCGSSSTISGSYLLATMAVQDIEAPHEEEGVDGVGVTKPKFGSW